MFDARLRPLIDPPLNATGRVLAQFGITANAITIAGFILGMAAVPAIIAGWFLTAAGFVIVSRLLDGLDGAVARATRKTDYGGFLDIVLDFIVYGAIPLAFAVRDPDANALAAAVLLMSFFANGSSFLAFAVMAAKRTLKTSAQGVKSLYYLSGLAEGAETIVFLVAICLLPEWFAVFAYVYAAICSASAGARIVLARALLADPAEPERKPEAKPEDAPPKDRA
ncbi:MAG: CDP-alcohol phosphatidyltransferase family protein [Hyphomicrobiaceae bacterium]